MLGSIDEILKGLPVNAVLRDRIIQMDSEIKRLTKENSNLQKEKTDLLTSNKKLVDELAEINESTNQFIPTHGLKIRKLPAGGYDETVAYCFHCESPMCSEHRTKPLTCSRCGYKSSIKNQHLSIVVGLLKGEPAPPWFRG